MVDKSIKFLENFIKGYWWIVLCALICHMCYEYGLKKRDKEFAKLYEQLNELQLQRKEALSLQENLILQINSQSDPEWVEFVLMKGLGVVSEGHKKVFFKKEESH